MFCNELISTHSKSSSLPVISFINGEKFLAFDIIFQPALHKQLEGGWWVRVVFERPFEERNVSILVEVDIGNGIPVQEVNDYCSFLEFRAL